MALEAHAVLAALKLPGMLLNRALLNRAVPTLGAKKMLSCTLVQQ